MKISKHKHQNTHKTPSEKCKKKNHTKKLKVVKHGKSE